MANRSMILLVTVMLLSSSLAMTSLAITNNHIPDSIIFTTGTMRYIPLEGGFLGIVADNGNHYDPINLDRCFKLDRVLGIAGGQLIHLINGSLDDPFPGDGLRIAFCAIIRDDLCSYHMWGIIIEILWLRVLP